MLKQFHQTYLIDARRYLKEIGDRDIRTVSAEELSDYIEETIGRLGLTPKAFCNMKTILRGGFKYAFKEKYVRFRIDDVLSDLEISKNALRKVFKEDEEEVFNEQETRKMLEYLISHPENAKHFVILLCLLTGMRVGEAATLKHSDIDGNMIRVRRTNTRYSNGDGTYTYAVKDYAKTEAGMRTAFVPEDYSWILGRLKMLHPDSDYIFLDKFGKPYSDNIINARLRTVCTNLGIMKKSSHKLRKTWFSIMLDNHLDNNLVTKVGGHTSILTSEKSYHRNRKTLERMSQVISGIEEFRMDDNLKEAYSKTKNAPMKGALC